MSGARQFSLTVGPDSEGLRLDPFLAGAGQGWSRSQVARWIEAGLVTRNGTPTKASHLVHPGDRIEVTVPAPTPSDLQPQELPLDVLYEDGHLIAINKPPGMVIHPAAGNPDGTLVNALLAHCRDLSGVGGVERPGIVHRLDKDTSGTLVVAKNAAALEQVASQFKNRSVRKYYLALVHGEMTADSGTIRMPIGRHPVDRKRMSTQSRKGREAETGWRVARRLDGFTLLELHLKTGRTHQIRVHCAAIGRPITGDPVYGRCRSTQDPVRIQALLGEGRGAMLRASRRIVFLVAVHRSRARSRDTE